MEFAGDAKVADNFESVIKIFRIMRPNIIDLENKDLEDSHLIMLLEFMQKLEMVTSINLRKNKIGNAGAEALADFIKEHD